jgi:hypothetical protein
LREKKENQENKTKKNIEKPYKQQQKRRQTTEKQEQVK